MITTTNITNGSMNIPQFYGGYYTSPTLTLQAGDKVNTAYVTVSGGGGGGGGTGTVKLNIAPGNDKLERNKMTDAERQEQRRQGADKWFTVSACGLQAATIKRVGGFSSLVAVTVTEEGGSNSGTEPLWESEVFATYKEADDAGRAALLGALGKLF